jgi:hypothetical protein
MAKKDACPRCGHQDGKENLTLVPLSQAKIAAGATVEVMATPQLPIKPVRLVIDPTIAPCFSVTDIRIGRNSQMACAGSVAGTLFPPIPADKTQIYNIAGIDKMPIGSTVSIVVRNMDDVPRDFSAIIYALTDFQND